MEEEASRPGRPSTWVSVMVRMMDMGKWYLSRGH